MKKYKEQKLQEDFIDLCGFRWVKIRENKINDFFHLFIYLEDNR